MFTVCLWSFFGEMMSLICSFIRISSFAIENTAGATKITISKEQVSKKLHIFHLIVRCYINSLEIPIGGIMVCVTLTCNEIAI